MTSSKFSPPTHDSLLLFLGFIIFSDIFNLLKYEIVIFSIPTHCPHLDEHVPGLPSQYGQVATEHVQHGGGLVLHSKGVAVTHHNLNWSYWMESHEFEPNAFDKIKNCLWKRHSFQYSQWENFRLTCQAAPNDWSIIVFIWNKRFSIKKLFVV